MARTAAVTIGNERICAKCNVQQPLENFRQFKHQKTGKFYREGQCDTCRVRYAQEYVWPGLKALRSQKHAIVDELKRAPCIDCGHTFPSVCMDFDHVRGVKKASITQIVAAHWSVDVLMTELEKCELVCANCHRIRTHKNRELHKARINAGRKRAGLKCFS